MKGMLSLLGVALLSWGLLAGPAALMNVESLEVSVPALLICLVPNLIVQGLVNLARGRKEKYQLVAVLAVFVFRPALTLAFGFAVYLAWPILRGRELSLVVWGIVFYLILLVMETLVLYRQEVSRGNGQA